VLEVPANKAVFKYVVNIIRFEKKYKNKVTHQEYRCPDYGASQGAFFIPQVHKIPGDIIGFYKGQDDEYPVEQFHSYKGIGNQHVGLGDTKCNLDGSYDGKKDKYSPYFLGIRFKFQGTPEDR
jgi:hypothetical protein